jgi:hypothetical protein
MVIGFGGKGVDWRVNGTVSVQLKDELPGPKTSSIGTPSPNFLRSLSILARRIEDSEGIVNAGSGAAAESGRAVDGVIVNLASSAVPYGDGEPGIVSRLGRVDADLRRSAGGREVEREFVILTCSISREDDESTVWMDSREDRELLEEREPLRECVWMLMTGRSSSKPWQERERLCLPWASLKGSETCTGE